MYYSPGLHKDELGKRDKMRDLASILSLFRNDFCLLNRIPKWIRLMTRVDAHDILNALIT